MIITCTAGLKKFSHKSVKLKCDFKVSDKCRCEWENSFSAVNVVRDKNDGKDICNPCAIYIKQSGDKSPHFKYYKDDFFFSKIDSEIKSYLLGWIASDGHVRRHRFTVKIIKEDIKILKLFIENISPTTSIKSALNCVSVDFTSAQLQEDISNLLRIKVGAKDHHIVLPHLDDAMMWHYLRGHFEGDGHVRKKSAISNRLQVSIACTSEDFKSQLQIWLKERNIISYISKVSLTLNGINAKCFLNNIYSNCNYFLDRKYDEYLKWKDYVPQTKKLDYVVAEQIRNRYKIVNISQKELAQIYNVKYNSINDILMNRSYKGLKQ